MARIQNTSLLRVLSAKAETLACSAANNQFPVPLRAIADRRKITAVEFRPLLVDAMLTTHSGGFRILFNSNGQDPGELQRCFDSDGRGELMPSRLRFSLAHELAHTLFYDLSENPPKVTRQFRSGGGKTELENLERNCDKLAARMLLPAPMLKTALRDMSSINPRTLLQLSERAGVSIEALVRRISDESGLLVERYFRGCIILAERRSDETRVVAIAKPLQLNIARDLRLMRPGEKWQLVTAAKVPTNPVTLPTLSSAKLIVETAQSSSQQTYEIQQVQTLRSPSASRFLITFEEVDSEGN